MDRRLHYGNTAKILHWSVAVLLLVQFPIGWFMPDIHAGPPGAAMSLHVSFGILILAVVAVRLIWRITHPVAPESSLPGWQRVSSEAVHWLLYALVLGTTLTGWLFASFRGWSLSLFSIVPLPMLASKSASDLKLMEGWHQVAEWALLVVIVLHISAALLHIFVYRDGVMRRMLIDEHQRP
ncbi:cytochrome b [Tardiphaga sp.]|uniref:cytochrome b n=1 Tax=Tardiphaga sp. TaxID=1926292 RepID=UPI00352B9A6C